ncbi:MAG TPA: sigma-54 dependent transcriptional regulator [Candidatus Binataceae bacterium]|nr:sigma-54 dependent transcriptional regulator [Candidatus Binataceae bacterium]
MAAPELKDDTAAARRPVSERALIGEHPTMVKLRALVERVAATDATVLITGESGTGKEVVARTIHDLSARRGRAFVPVNCAAIPHELLESEMFGHERGAFTGAFGPRQGLFSTADGGTIFLDEIGEMPMQLQAKLLRVLEDGIVRPVGSDRSNKVDVRVIAASNSDLAGAIKKGTFREDLFYRLQVVPIMIAPLRERRSDIPLLVEYFLGRMRARFPGRHWEVTQEAMVSLWSYDWPGNVRELENIVERLVILCEGSAIDASLLPPNMAATTRAAADNHVPGRLAEGGVNLNAMVRELEGRMINEALRQTGGNKQAAARLLGLKRTTFSAKLRRCGVIAPNNSNWRDDA